MSKRRKRVLFLLAHQDDECLFASRIARELRLGHRVEIAFVTDGTANGADPAVRDAESRRALRSLGVADDAMHFVGSALRLPDGALHTRFDDAWSGLTAALGPRRVDRIFTCAYDGGHQDHDATHVLALALASHHRCLHAAWQFALYNGYGTRWRYFRVGKPIPTAGRRLQRSLRGEPRLRFALLCRHYPSQWPSWLGLFPGLFIRLVIGGRECFAALRPPLPPRRPHPGKLLYERRSAATFEAFGPAAARFLDDRVG